MEATEQRRTAASETIAVALCVLEMGKALLTK
jgi:hypothetical protein